MSSSSSRRRWCVDVLRQYKDACNNPYFDLPKHSEFLEGCDKDPPLAQLGLCIDLRSNFQEWCSDFWEEKVPGGHLHFLEKLIALDRECRQRFEKARSVKQKQSLSPSKSETKSESKEYLFPRILRWLEEDLVFVYKPPFWDCSTKETPQRRVWTNLEGMWRHLLKNDISSCAADKKHRPHICWWLQVLFPHIKIFSSFEDKFGLCHSLESRVSGILVVARTRAKHREMRGFFRENKIANLHVALVSGRVLADDERGVRLLSDVAEEETPSSVATHVHVLGYAQQPHEKSCSFSLCAIETRSCRTHEIGRQMTRLMTHVVGELEDSSADPSNMDGQLVERTFLHSYAVAFPQNSGSGAPLVCQMCPLPRDLREALQRLENCMPRESGGECFKTTTYLTNLQPDEILQSLAKSGFVSETHAARTRDIDGWNLDLSNPEEWYFTLDLFPWTSTTLLGGDVNDLERMSPTSGILSGDILKKRFKAEPRENGLLGRKRAFLSRDRRDSSQRRRYLERRVSSDSEMKRPPRLRERHEKSSSAERSRSRETVKRD